VKATRRETRIGARSTARGGGSIMECARRDIVPSSASWRSWNPGRREASGRTRNVEPGSRRRARGRRAEGKTKRRGKVSSPLLGDTHLASGPLLLARWPRIFSTTVTLPLLAASSSSWSLPMVHLRRGRAPHVVRALVNLCFHYDYSRFIDPTWPSWADWRAATRPPREAPGLLESRRARERE